MSLPHAILAVLSHANRTGYDLMRKIDGSIAHFWPATHQQIYLELKRLHDKHLVRFTEQTQHGKPNKKMYAITQAGLATLKKWAQQPLDVSPPKDALLIKIFASHLMNKKEVVTELRSHQAYHEKKLAEYQAIETQFFANTTMPDPLMAQYLTLRRGIISEQAWLTWCVECLERM